MPKIEAFQSPRTPTHPWIPKIKPCQSLGWGLRWGCSRRRRPHRIERGGRGGAGPVVSGVKNHRSRLESSGDGRDKVGRLDSLRWELRELEAAATSGPTTGLVSAACRQAPRARVALLRAVGCGHEGAHDRARQRRWWTSSTGAASSRDSWPSSAPHVRTGARPSSTTTVGMSTS